MTPRFLLLVCAVWPLRLAAQHPITLDEAIREARAANAELPVSALDVDVARTLVREAQAGRRPRLSVESWASTGGPLAYTTSQGQALLVAGDTLLDGGLRRANIEAGRHRIEVAGAGFRIAEKDLDLAVRLRFSELLKAEHEITFRRQGIDRLRSYLSQIEGRKAAGQPVGSDVLTAQVRLGTEEATLADADRALDEARLELNDLMGRDPAGPLALAPLPPPTPPESLADTPWLTTPEVRQAAASRAAAEASIGATRAERRPLLSVSANVGVLPVFADSNAGTGLNSGGGFGGAVVLSLSWPIWNGGVYRARLDRAQLEAQQARNSQIAVQRRSRLAWRVASAQQLRLYQQVQAWARNVPLARDAYLQTESMYNGGAATTLEVLDAYAAWINANEAYADALLRYRLAEANSLRWGTP